MDAEDYLLLERAEIEADLENCVPGVGETLRRRIMDLLDERNKLAGGFVLRFGPEA